MSRPGLRGKVFATVTVDYAGWRGGSDLCEATQVTETTNKQGTGASYEDGGRPARSPYRTPCLRAHGPLAELIQQGSDVPAPDPFSGLSNQAT